MKTDREQNPFLSGIRSYTIPALTARDDDRQDSISGPIFRNTLIAKTNAAGMELFRMPSRIEAMVIGVCRQGECRIDTDRHMHTLGAGQLFIFTPRDIIHVRSESDFRADVLAVSNELMEQIRFNIQYMLPLINHIGRQQFFDLPGDTADTLHKLIESIEAEIQVVSDTPFTAEIVRDLVSATIYKIADVLTRRIDQLPERRNTPNDRAESYFRQFIRLLGEHYLKERSVSFYARQMCITPKYLTTLIKRVSQRSVSEWIDSFVVQEAKTLLCYSDMSIQEIAYYLSFPNQSFFGSYFRRNTGMSPSQYRSNR